MKDLIVMKRIKKFLLLVAGFMTFGIGTVDIFVPLLPTTPFYLLTYSCFRKGSKRYFTWFINTKLYKNYAEYYVTTRSMTLFHKVATCLYASVILIISFFFIPNIFVKVILVGLMLSMLYIFTFRIKTVPSKKEILGNNTLPPGVNR